MTDYVKTTGERLLVWMSELGAGTWQRFREACAWELRHEHEEDRPAAGMLAAHFAQRGYAEVDFSSRRWAIAPTVVTTVPGLPSAAIVVGGRARRTLACWEALDDPDVYLEPHKEVGRTADAHRVSHHHAVRTVFVVAEDIRALERVSNQMGATFRWDAGPELAKRLPTMHDDILRAPRLPAPPESHIARYDPITGRWEDVDAATEVGFYRFRPKRLIGPTQFRLITSVGALDVERSTGLYAVLDRSNVDVLLYRDDDVNGSFYVRADAALPALHARALFLCSGLAPAEVTLPGVGLARHYINVPRSVAERISASLNQRLGATNALNGS